MTLIHIGYKYITTFCAHTDGALYIFFTTAPHTSWVHNCSVVLVLLNDQNSSFTKLYI